MENWRSSDQFLKAMEVNNSNVIIVDDRVTVSRRIGPLCFNALNNNNKPLVSRKMDIKVEPVHQKNHNSEEIVLRNYGDMNQVGLPLEIGSTEICDISNFETILPNLPLMNPNLSHLNQNFVRSKYQNSVRSWKSDEARGTSSTNSFSNRPFSDSSSQISRPFSDSSIRSLASIGMGSTDGRRMIIRKIPQSPSELFNIVNPPT